MAHVALDHPYGLHLDFLPRTSSSLSSWSVSNAQAIIQYLPSYGSSCRHEFQQIPHLLFNYSTGESFPSCINISPSIRVFSMFPLVKVKQPEAFLYFYLFFRLFALRYEEKFVCFPAHPPLLPFLSSAHLVMCTCDCWPLLLKSFSMSSAQWNIFHGHFFHSLSLFRSPSWCLLWGLERQIKDSKIKFTMPPVWHYFNSV